MNKGLLAGALIQGLGNLATQSIQSRASAEAEQAKTRRELALEALKQQGAVNGEYAKRLPLPLDNPQMLDHLAIQTGLSQPDIQGLLTSARTGQGSDTLSPQQKDWMAQAYRKIGQALTSLDPRTAESQKHLADAEQTTHQTQIAHDYLTNSKARPAIASYYGARYGHRDEPYTIGSGVVLDRRNGQYTALPPNPNGSNSLIESSRLLRDQSANLRREKENIRQQLASDLTLSEADKASLKAYMETLGTQIAEYDRVLKQNLLPGAGAPGNYGQDNAGVFMGR